MSEDFFDTLEKGVRAVLENKKSTAAQKMAAINAGAKLLMIKNKLKDPDADDNKSFFGKK